MSIPRTKNYLATTYDGLSYVVSATTVERAQYAAMRRRLHGDSSNVLCVDLTTGEAEFGAVTKAAMNGGWEIERWAKRGEEFNIFLKKE